MTSEEVSSDEGHAWGEVVVTVPSSRLDTTLDALSELGTVERRTTSTSDESSTYTDTSSRIKTMRASIARVQRLIASTDDIDQLVTLESDLSTRQADLESLLAQLKDLERRTSTSPVTVSLSQEGAPEREDEDATGFVAGLSAGWDAFGSSAAVLLTVLGRSPLRRARAARHRAARVVVAAPAGQRAARAGCWWTSSATRVRTSGSVVGSTPWPRLKM